MSPVGPVRQSTPACASCHPQAVDAARDKHATRAIMEEAGLPTPRNMLISAASELSKVGSRGGARLLGRNFWQLGQTQTGAAHQLRQVAATAAAESEAMRADLLPSASQGLHHALPAPAWPLAGCQPCGVPRRDQAHPRRRLAGRAAGGQQGVAVGGLRQGDARGTRACVAGVVGCGRDGVGGTPEE